MKASSALRKQFVLFEHRFLSVSSCVRSPIAKLMVTEILVSWIGGPVLPLNVSSTVALDTLFCRVIAVTSTELAVTGSVEEYCDGTVDKTDIE